MRIAVTLSITRSCDLTKFALFMQLETAWISGQLDLHVLAAWECERDRERERVREG